MQKLLIKIIFALVLGIPSSVYCQSVCRVEGSTEITPTIFRIDVGGSIGIRENETEGTEIWNSALTSQMTFSNSSRPTVLEFSSDTSEFIIKTGSGFKNIADTIKDDDNILTATVYFRCNADNVLLEFRLIVLVIPVNSQPPVFSITELNYAITTPWNLAVPLNYKDVVTVIDADFQVGNNFTLEISDARFRPDFNNITSELSLFSTISRFPTDAISFTVTADDGVHQATLVVDIIVTDKENLLAPKFKENYYYVDEIDPSLPSEEELFIVEVEAIDPDNPDTPDLIEYSTGEADIRLDGNRVYFRNRIPEDFPFIFEITATEKEGLNPLSTNVAVIVNYPVETVFEETPYTEMNVKLPLAATDPVTTIDPLVDAEITLEDNEYFEINDEHEIVAKRELNETDIFTDANPNGVYLLVLKSGKQRATVAIYFELPIAPPQTTETVPACTTPEIPTTAEACTCPTDTTTQCPEPTPCSTEPTPSTEYPTTECPTTCQTEPTQSTESSTNCPICDGTTEATTECPTTCDPCVCSTDTTTTDRSTDCAPQTTLEACDCSNCTTGPTEQTDCPTTSLVTEPCPPTPPPGECECSTGSTLVTEPCPPTPPPGECNCSTGSSDTQTDCPTTSFVTEPCPPTPPPGECNCSTGSTDTQTDCPTTSFVTEPCPPTPPPGECNCSTGSTDAQTDCPTTSFVTEPCPPTPPPGECNCSTGSTDAPTGCPTTECPTTCPTEPTQSTECPTTECPVDCTTNPSVCPPCDDDGSSTTEAPGCSEDSQTGLIAGVVVTSLLFVGATGAAGFLYFKIRKLTPDLSDISKPKEDDFGLSRTKDAGSSVGNPLYDNKSSFFSGSDTTPILDSDYQEIAPTESLFSTSSAPASTPRFSIPSIAATTATASPFAGGVVNNAFSSSDIGNSSTKDPIPRKASLAPKEIPVDYDDKELKSSLAKPKEIPADYEGAPEVAPKEDEAPKKAKKKGGVSFGAEEVIPIADETPAAVDISNDNDVEISERL